MASEVAAVEARTALQEKMKIGPGKIGLFIFGVALVIGIIYAGSHLLRDLADMHSTSAMPYIPLGVALLVALGFEFVNGFHEAIDDFVYSPTSIK